MTTIVVAPLANYPAGITTIGEFAVADAIAVLKVSVARCTSAAPTIWPNTGTAFSANLDFFDGAQWIANLFFVSDSGGIRQSHGADVPATYAVWALPAGTGRKLRGSVNITGGSIRSSVTVDVT